MTNQDEWIKSLPNTNTDNELNKLDYEKLENTVSKKKSFNSVKKYSLISFVFVCGLLLVSIIKNATRNLQKEINQLEVSISVVKFNLNQALLDNEVITSPGNLSRLAQELLNSNLVAYKKSQIKILNESNQDIAIETKANILKKNNKNLTKNITTEIAKKIEDKKTEIKKLQELYRNPKSIPNEVKKKMAKQITKKKFELKNLYESPKSIFTVARVGKWTVVQVVKVFLGIPVVPGK